MMRTKALSPDNNLYLVIFDVSVEYEESPGTVTLHYSKGTTVLTAYNLLQLGRYMADIMSIYERLGIKIPGITDNMVALTVDVRY